MCFRSRLSSRFSYKTENPTGTQGSKEYSFQVILSGYIPVQISEYTHHKYSCSEVAVHLSVYWNGS